MSKLELVAREIRNLKSEEQMTLLSRLPGLLKIRTAKKSRLNDGEIAKLADMSRKARITGRGIRSFETWETARRYLWSL